MQLLLPFVVGHLMRPWLAEWAARSKKLLTLTDRSTIVLAVYTSFSAAVLGGIWQQMPIRTLLVLLVVCVVMLTAVLLATRFGARALGFSREDEISIVFCGSKKSLVTGVPMARVMFPAADAGAVILPLMLFHQIQLMVCVVSAALRGRIQGGRDFFRGNPMSSSSECQHRSGRHETGDGGEYPQSGRNRMIMPQPVAVLGSAAANPEKGLLKQMDAEHVFMMGDNPQLPRMPKAPKLLDFFHLRFSEIAFRHLLQSAKTALDGGPRARPS